LRCRSAGLMLVIGRLDFVFFWWKQHLICTDQNVSATNLANKSKKELQALAGNSLWNKSSAYARLVPKKWTI